MLGYRAALGHLGENLVKAAVGHVVVIFAALVFAGEDAGAFPIEFTPIRHFSGGLVG